MNTSLHIEFCHFTATFSHSYSCQIFTMLWNTFSPKHRNMRNHLKSLMIKKTSDMGQAFVLKVRGNSEMGVREPFVDQHEMDMKKWSSISHKWEKLFLRFDQHQDRETSFSSAYTIFISNLKKLVSLKCTEFSKGDSINKIFTWT